MNTVPPISSHYHGDPTSKEHGLFIKQNAEMIKKCEETIHFSST